MGSAVTTTDPIVTDALGMPVTTETVTTADYGNFGTASGYVDATEPIQPYTQNIFQ